MGMNLLVLCISDTSAKVTSIARLHESNNRKWNKRACIVFLQVVWGYTPIFILFILVSFLWAIVRITVSEEEEEEREEKEEEEEEKEDDERVLVESVWQYARNAIKQR